MVWGQVYCGRQALYGLMKDEWQALYGLMNDGRQALEVCEARGPARDASESQFITRRGQGIVETSSDLPPGLRQGNAWHAEAAEASLPTTKPKKNDFESQLHGGCGCSVCLSVCLSVSPDPSFPARLSLRTEGVAAREKLIHVDVFEPFEVAQIPGQADLKGRGLGRMV